MTMNANEVNAVVTLSKKVIDLLDILDFEDEAESERRAIEEEYGDCFDRLPEDEWTLRETWVEFKYSWTHLVRACGGDRALAAEVSGRSLADIEYYL